MNKILDIPRIFISHSWEDNYIARKIDYRLKRDGAETWIDNTNINGGDILAKKIGKALKWCDTLVLLWSETASKSDWVEEEWTNALALRKKIIPCILDGTETPPMLSSRVYIDFSTFETGYKNLCRTLKLKELVPTPLKEEEILNSEYGKRAKMDGG